MMKRFHVLALVAICVLAGCKQSSSSQSDGSVTIEANGAVTCDFDLVKDTLTIPLSEWVEDFQIVRFEDNDTAIFKMRWPLITEHYIGICQRGGGAFKLFDRQGNFLCDVGGVGGGPGEYKGLYSQAIDEKNGWIYLAPISWKKYLDAVIVSFCLKAH